MDKINRIAMRLSKPHSREQVTTKEDSIGMFAANPQAACRTGRAARANPLQRSKSAKSAPSIHSMNANGRGYSLAISILDSSSRVSAFLSGLRR